MADHNSRGDEVLDDQTLQSPDNQAIRSLDPPMSNPTLDDQRLQFMADQAFHSLDDKEPPGLRRASSPHLPSPSLHLTFDDQNLHSFCLLALSDHQYSATALGSGLGNPFTFTELWNTLLTTHCALCGNDGIYLYLITGRRLCYTCFTTYSTWKPVTSVEATWSTTLTRKQLTKRFPFVRTLSGRYSNGGNDDSRECSTRESLFDLESIRCSEYGEQHKWILAEDLYRMGPNFCGR